MSLKVKFIQKEYLCYSGVLCVYVPLGHSTRKQLIRRYFFDGLQTYMEKKCEGNKSKIILGNLISTMDKMDRNCGNKTQNLCRCYSNYVLSKLIVRDGLEDLWKRENPESSEFIRWNRFSCLQCRITGSILT